ncbi:hypothetical protein J6590_079927 [Homalodisca vitripennis]|nr:hypothetical protein J6590_079927 [Homalodisca vitripennis]
MLHILCDRASARSALTQRSSLRSICANPAFKNAPSGQKPVQPDILDLGSRLFAAGQAYVAQSCKTFRRYSD